MSTTDTLFLIGKAGGKVTMGTFLKERVGVLRHRRNYTMLAYALILLGGLAIGAGMERFRKETVMERRQADFQKLLMDRLDDIELVSLHHERKIRLIYDVAGYDINDEPDTTSTAEEPS